jgi:hypothetical protein
MAELIDVVNSMFKNRQSWNNITDSDKEKYFFIINRYLSKQYPTKAYFVNIKNVNKSVCLDLWFHFMKDKPYPVWFWSKSSKTENSKIDKNDFQLLKYKLNLDKDSDLDYLIEQNFELIKEELKFFKTKTK